MTPDRDLGEARRQIAERMLNPDDTVRRADAFAYDVTNRVLELGAEHGLSMWQAIALASSALTQALCAYVYQQGETVE